MIMNSQIPSAFAEGERELTGVSWQKKQLSVSEMIVMEEKK